MSFMGAVLSLSFENMDLWTKNTDLTDQLKSSIGAVVTKLLNVFVF